MNGGPEDTRDHNAGWEPWEKAPTGEPSLGKLPYGELPDAEIAEAEWTALEVELTRALRPVELPAGFADRVLARAALASPQPRRSARVLAFPGWRVALSGAVAAALVAGSLVGLDVHQSHERARARAAATQQFETATRITDEALAHTREQLERAGVFGQ